MGRTTFVIASIKSISGNYVREHNPWLSLHYNLKNTIFRFVSMIEHLSIDLVATGRTIYLSFPLISTSGHCQFVDSLWVSIINTSVILAAITVLG